jgi:hypothetical protein
MSQSDIIAPILSYDDIAFGIPQSLRARGLSEPEAEIRIWKICFQAVSIPQSAFRIPHLNTPTFLWMTPFSPEVKFLK